MTAVRQHQPRDEYLRPFRDRLALVLALCAQRFTLHTIGRLLGISKQRAHQLRNKANGTNLAPLGACPGRFSSKSTTTPDLPVSLAPPRPNPNEDLPVHGPAARQAPTPRDQFDAELGPWLRAHGTALGRASVLGDTRATALIRSMQRLDRVYDPNAATTLRRGLDDFASGRRH